MTCPRARMPRARAQTFPFRGRAVFSGKIPNEFSRRAHLALAAQVLFFLVCSLNRVSALYLSLSLSLGAGSCTESCLKKKRRHRAVHVGSETYRLLNGSPPSVFLPSLPRPPPPTLAYSVLSQLAQSRINQISDRIAAGPRRRIV